MVVSRLFQVIDLDRTLFDTSKFAKLLTDEIDKEHPGIGVDLDARFEYAHKNETTFFLLRHLREEMGNDQFEKLVDEIISREESDAFLMPGAKERIAFAETLSTQKPAWGILTYGDEVDQKMKIAIAGLQNTPVIIITTPNKCVAIESWQNTDGTFTLPVEFGGHTVAGISLEDDKARAFIGIPKNVTGIWMKNEVNQDKRSKDVLPKGVKPVDSLYESIEYLKSIYG